MQAILIGSDVLPAFGACPLLEWLEGHEGSVCRDCTIVAIPSANMPVQVLLNRSTALDTCSHLEHKTGHMQVLNAALLARLFSFPWFYI